MSTRKEVTTMLGGKLLLSARELGALLGVNRSTIWTWHSSGRIPLPVKIAGTTRWRKTEIEEWIAAGCPPRVRWQALSAGRQQAK